MADAPIGARTFGDSIDFSSIPNRNPVEALRTHNRFDPYWDGLWSLGSAPMWMSHARAKRQVAAGLATLPKSMSADPETAIENLFLSHRRSTTLDVLGVLDTWRTGTAQQIAAMTGRSQIMGRDSGIMREMFSAELTDTGSLTNGLNPKAASVNARLYRPSQTSAFDEKVRDRISYPEWVSVTGGVPFRSGRQYERHNLLATELALRVAEFTDVAALVGEKLSTLDNLGYSGLGIDPPDRLFQRGADLTIIREDGMRIVIEVTATRSSDLGDKARRWAELLHQRRMDDSGLTVIFLTAERPDTPAGKRWNVRNGTFRYVAQAAREFPGVSFDRTATRIGVADWREWFPEPGKISPAFLSLEVDTPSGADPASPWERRSFLDIFDREFSPSQPERFSAVIDNSALLRGNPHWLREGLQEPDLTPIMHARSEYSGVNMESLKEGLTVNQQKHFATPRPPMRLRG